MLPAILSTKHRISRQKTNKKTLDLNYTLDQIDLTDIYKHSIKKQENKHSSQAHVYHSLGQDICWSQNKS